LTAGSRGGGVINIEPFIRRKKRSACHHIHVEVDDDAASLTCIDCDAELDPWWFLRRQAHNREEWQASIDARRQEMDALVEKHNAWVVKANETIRECNAQIQHLYDVKNRLGNALINGERLGNLARRRPRRRAP
jgi:hypothetical protein